MKIKRNLKKIASLLLAVVMVLAMSVTAFAEETRGSITINGISAGNTYSIYKLFDLESYDTASGAYSYKVNIKWTGFFETDEAKEYITIDEQGYVTWKTSEDDDTVAAFAKKALAYAEANDIAPVKSSATSGDFVTETTGDEKSSGKFQGLDLGYYLIDSTMGALCGLTTTNPDASINAKNAAPTIDKQVQEDSTGKWGEKNTADIGQTVYFCVTVNVHAGAQNYVLHDKMSAGLTFKNVTRVEHVIPGTTSTPTVVDESNYEVITTGFTDDCTFEVKFTNDFCDSLETNDKVIIYYEAMLNRNAIVAADGNLNEAKLEFGEDHTTTSDTTKTYTYRFDLVKTDSQNKLIDGAEFRIYDDETATEGHEIAVVLMDDGVTYRRARADEKGVNIVVKDGQVRVVGFDNGTYYLEETVTPNGYNQLAARQKFIISDGNLDSIFNGEIYTTNSGVHVVNKSGTMLPSTGGIGTTIFYILGGLLVFGAVVLMVTKKRMNSND